LVVTVVISCEYMESPLKAARGWQIGASAKQKVLEINTVYMWHSNSVCYEIQTIDAEMAKTVTSSHLT
jgi:hypothetical protein